MKLIIKYLSPILIKRKIRYEIKYLVKILVIFFSLFFHLLHPQKLRQYLKMSKLTGIFFHAEAVVTPAVPSIPGSPFLAIPANNFLISAIARPGFSPWN